MCTGAPGEAVITPRAQCTVIRSCAALNSQNCIIHWFVSYDSFFAFFLAMMFICLAGLCWSCRDKPLPATMVAAVGQPGASGTTWPVGPLSVQARGLIAVGQRLAPRSEARTHPF